LNPAREAIKRRRQVSVVESTAILRVSLHGIVAFPAASEIIVLAIPGGLVETRLYNWSCIQLHQ